METRKDCAYMQNRELSWLRFNRRVLQEACDEMTPPLERLKFISIYTSNLDEFFMIRVGSIFDMQTVDPDSRDNKTNWRPEEELEHIYDAVKPLYREREETYNTVCGKMAECGVHICSVASLGKRERDYVKDYYTRELEPLLSPQIVDAHHPFPHLQNGLLHLGLLLRKNENDKPVFGVVPIPSLVPTLLFLPGALLRCIPVEDIVYTYAKRMFSGYSTSDRCIFCVTRNADINPIDEAYDFKVDFRSRMKELLKKRRRLAPVRLETRERISDAFRDYLCEKLSLRRKQVYTTRAPIHLDFAFALSQRLTAEQKKQMLYAPYTPCANPSLRQDERIAPQIEKKDVLLSYPYESMEPFLRLVREAATDPLCISVKITIYRLASRAKLIEYLCAAAENGVEVTAIIELRARFDEQNNIDWSERLEEAGCKVIYGFDEYKIHSKLCLITRRAKNGMITYITQIGTGNYNEKTAAQYTDLCLMTANADIGREAHSLFNDLAICNLNGEYEHLLVAPQALKRRILALMDEQIAKGEDGRIFFKLNSLTDMEIIAKLREASCAGVRINMMIRGICCILPGIPGVTENITVTSIVGRYLEHSRIYCFGRGEDEKLYISSADFMTRNTERRVELACPIYDAEAKKKIHRLIEALSLDTQKARRLCSDGSYARLGDGGVDSQTVLMRASEKDAAAAEKEKSSPAWKTVLRGLLKTRL